MDGGQSQGVEGGIRVSREREVGDRIDEGCEPEARRRDFKASSKQPYEKNIARDKAYKAIRCCDDREGGVDRQAWSDELHDVDDAAQEPSVCRWKNIGLRHEAVSVECDRSVPAGVPLVKVTEPHEWRGREPIG